jgi:hypothetical protein
MDLDERESGRFVQRAHFVAIRLVRADEARQRDRAGIAEELGDLADAPDVLLAVLLGESQVLVDAHADVVAVETIGELAHLKERALQRNGDRALAAARQTGQPDRGSLLPEHVITIFAGDVAAVPGHVGCLLFCHCPFPSSVSVIVCGCRQAPVAAAVGLPPFRETV